MWRINFTRQVLDLRNHTILTITVQRFCANQKDRLIYSKTLKNNLRLGVDIHYDNPMVSFSFSIGAGRFYENDQVLGISHLLEHCIFAPNKDYPKIGQLTEFIDNNGGDINAWTDDYSTNFHVICPVQIAIDALDMLLNKLLFPNFSKKNVETEIAAIDAEFSSKKYDEGRRLASVQKTMCNKLHPYYRFSMGNKRTFTALPLGQVIEQLFSYHKRHFAANNMAFAMSFPAIEDAEATQIYQHVLNTISPVLENIPSSNAGQSLPNVMAFSPLLHNQLVTVKSKSNAVILSVIIDKCDVEELDNLALTMLETTISSMHKGGLVDMISDKFRLLDFAVKNGFEDQLQTEIQLCLRFEAFLNHKNVVTLSGIFSAFINSLVSQKLPRWRFREKQKQADLQHRFAKPKHLLERTVELAEQLRQSSDLTERKSLQVDSLEVQERLTQILKQIQSQKLYFYMFTSEWDFDRKTDHYDVEYSIEDMPDQAPNDGEKLRFCSAPQNTFLPSSIEVFEPKTPESSNRCYTPDHFKWQSTSFRLDYWLCYKDKKPLGDIYVSFSGPELAGSIQTAVAKRIWLDCLQTHLKATFFQTKEAGLYFKVYGHQKGISVQTSGFTDRQLLLMYELLNHVTNIVVSDAEFARGKRNVESKISRSLWQKPINKLFSSLSESIHSSVIKPETLLDASANLTYDEFDNYQKSFFNVIKIESLMVGNWPLALGDRLKQHLLNRFKNQFCIERTEMSEISNPTSKINLKSKTVEISNTDDQAFMLFQSFGETDRLETKLKPIALSLLIEAFLSPLLFVEMRNVRKVGYNLGVGYKPIERHAGIVVYAQSPNLDRDLLKSEMLDGLNTVIFSSKSNGIDFTSLKRLVCEQINSPVENASALGRYIWLHYDNPEPLNYAERLREYVKSMTEEEFWQHCESLLQENDNQLILQTKVV